MKLTLVARNVSKDDIGIYCFCELCYFEDVCAQTEHVPSEIQQCDKEGQNFYWELEKDNG